MGQIAITIKHCDAGLVRYERDNEGLREKLEVPYRKRWINAKFTLPSGKKKCEQFPEGCTTETILAMVAKKYSNFKFVLTDEANDEPSVARMLLKERDDG